jgi:hypothetical protein
MVVAIVIASFSYVTAELSLGCNYSVSLSRGDIKGKLWMNVDAPQEADSEIPSGIRQS